MAQGDTIERGSLFQNTAHYSAKLLDGEVGTTTGTWIDTRGWAEATIDINGITTATVQIHGSNAPAKPADATDGRQLGPNITSDTFVHLDTPVRWIKCKITSYVAGTVNAWLHAET